jgi:hypothetical protein
MTDGPREVLRRVRTVPDAHRSFTVSAAEAARRFAIDQRLLPVLLDLGLPGRGTGDDLRFDAFDLENIAFGLGLAAPQRIVVLRWGRFLGPALQEQRGHYELRITWKCPEPGHAGSCAFTAAPLLSAVTDAGPAHAAAEGTAIAQVQPLCQDQAFPDGFEAVAGAARKLVFHRLPEGLVDDLGYLRSTGLADCRLGSRYLMGVARDAGLTVRPASGFFLGAPFPARHVWFEVLVGDAWAPADPFFLDTLVRWGVIQPQDWPLTRSPRNVLLRLESSESVDMSLVMHGPRIAPVALLAQWVPTGVTA